MNSKEILEKYLHACYEIHHVKIPDKYYGYILKAMEEYGNSMKRHSTTMFRKAKIWLVVILVISLILLLACFGLVVLLSQAFMIKYIGL